MTGILCDSTALANSWHPVARSVEVAAAPVEITLLAIRQLADFIKP